MLHCRLCHPPEHERGLGHQLGATHSAWRGAGHTVGGIFVIKKPKSAWEAALETNTLITKKDNFSQLVALQLINSSGAQSLICSSDELLLTHFTASPCHVDCNANPHHLPLRKPVIFMQLYSHDCYPLCLQHLPCEAGCSCRCGSALPSQFGAVRLLFKAPRLHTEVCCACDARVVSSWEGGL